MFIFSCDVSTDDVANNQKDNHLTMAPTEKYDDSNDLPSNVSSDDPEVYPSNSLTDQETVCILMEEAYDLFSGTTFESFFDSDLWDLLEIENPTQSEIEEMDDYVSAGLTLMGSTSSAFASAFTSVVALDLTIEEFNDFAKECEQPSSRCWLCSETRCLKAATLFILGEDIIDFYPYSLLGAIGMSLFCE